jgi:hypothetical protein
MTAKEFIAKKNLEFERAKAKGTHLRFRRIDRKGTTAFIREAWTFMVQSHFPRKVFVFERMRLAEKSVTNRAEYRFGYYIIGENGNKKNKWTWGQFCPLIPVSDFTALIDQAKAHGVIQ